MKFVTFKVTKDGQVDSVLINGIKKQYTDYSKYIKASPEPLKSHYQLVKKSNLLNIELFQIFEGLNNVCLGDSDAAYVVPVIINFLTQSESYYSTCEEAIRNFFQYGEHNYFFLAPIKVVHTNPIKKNIKQDTD